MERSSPKGQLHARRLNTDRFRSPDIQRKGIGGDSVTAYAVKKNRRAKSTEPSLIEPDKVTLNMATEVKPSVDPPQEETINKRWSLVAKNYENMSKQEIINNYRLLMNEKLRLERFLSVMTKNNEMARNRLESDLLDAMMCIEDLKQALEIRMARRQRIDPREAEERRYLIRQNKKLLNQLYDSAKKIERLEVTKVEMKEQLELLDFQIVEVENQKAMMEEELRKIPPTHCKEIQTEEDVKFGSQIIPHLKEQLNLARSDLSSQKAEMAAALAKVTHLDNLVRELRRDNIELRDQLARLDDTENSLAESDKPLAADYLSLKSRLNEQSERVAELEEKLKSSKAYSEMLESRLQTLDSKHLDDHMFNSSTDMTSPEVQAAMYDAMNADDSVSRLRMPRLNDLLLQETIRTFQALLAERDQELAQLRQFIRSQTGNLASGELVELNLPKLFVSSVQTDLDMSQAEKLAVLSETLIEGGLLINSSQFRAIMNDLRLIGLALSSCENVLENSKPEEQNTTVCFENLLISISDIRQAAERLKLKCTLSEINARDINCSCSTHNENADLNDQQTVKSLQSKVEALKEEVQRLQNCNSSNEERFVRGNIGEFHISYSAPNRFTDSETLKSSSKDKHVDTSSPTYYVNQLQELRQTGDLELTRAHLSLSERRRKELGRRITELTDELARARAEARSAETSLSAARRTEAALRRRLLAAMDLHAPPGSCEEGTPNHHPPGGSLTGGGTELKDLTNVAEMETNISRLESINASLTEAAQLDRVRLHDQTIRIEQLESENRALLDRVSSLQATESSAQRGIVRLQALYEDMLREYAESKSQDFNWRYRDHFQSKSRILKDSSRLEQTNVEVQNINTSLKRIANSSAAVSITVPAGPCQAPACIAVRSLLTAFQARYSELMDDWIQSHNKDGKTLSDVNNSVIEASKQNTPILIKELQSQINGMLNSSLKSDLALFEKKLLLCQRLLCALEYWITCCFQRSDLEVAQLRSRFLELHTTTINESKQTVFSSTLNQNASQPFSCSIVLSKKPDLPNLLMQEQEILQLRDHVRNLEAQLQLIQTKNGVAAIQNAVSTL